MTVRSNRRQVRRGMLRLGVWMLGLSMSVILHEAFHIVMHWGDIAGIGVFPNGEAIVEIILASSHTYDLQLEETIAYVITLLVILATMVVADRVAGPTTEKSARELLFPREPHAEDLMELAYQSYLPR